MEAFHFRNTEFGSFNFRRLVNVRRGVNATPDEICQIALAHLMLALAQSAANGSPPTILLCRGRAKAAPQHVLVDYLIGAGDERRTAVLTLIRSNAACRF